MAEEEDSKGEQPIVVKKIVKGGGHHGGAWKVAYADFVTAMMAFFLLLWLLNVSTDEQRAAISSYFDPAAPKVSDTMSGAGGVLGGLSMSPQGAMVTNVQPLGATNPAGNAINNRSTQKSPDGGSKKGKSLEEKAKEMARLREEKKFEETKELIEQMIENDPSLQELKENLLVDMTPEGLRIQIVDEEGRSMFASGSADMKPLTRELIGKMTNIIEQLPNDISIRGHTDSVPYGAGASYTNWELSADRANSARREILEAGFKADRIHNVIGKADTEHLLPDEPNNARNRRISIILLKQEITNPDAFDDAAADLIASGEVSEDEDTAGTNATPQIPIGTFRRTPGAVEFP